MGEGEGEGRGKKAFLFFFSLPLCRSVSRVLPVAREGGEAGRAGGRARWMDGSLPADALRFGPLPLPPRRLPAARPRARPGWAGRDGHEGKMGSHAKRIQEEPQTNGRTDGWTPSWLCVRLGLSLPLSLPPSFPPPRPHVCLNSECGPSLISSPFSLSLSVSSPSRLYFAIIPQPSEANT